jgi:hypothetical protein
MDAFSLYVAVGTAHLPRGFCRSWGVAFRAFAWSWDGNAKYTCSEGDRIVAGS